MENDEEGRVGFQWSGGWWEEQGESTDKRDAEVKAERQETVITMVTCRGLISKWSDSHGTGVSEISVQ